MEFNLLGKWDKYGYPDYLYEQIDISPEYINRLNNSLPEKKPVTIYNTQYLTNTHSRNIIIKTDEENFDGTDIYATFITEGAGYKNVFGYYWYELHDGYTVPTKLSDDVWVPMTYDDKDDVDESGKSVIHKTIIFPNASLFKQGGNLKGGEKVKLLYDIDNPEKKFPNNVGVGFFLIPNGWDSNASNITIKSNIVYSDRIFNSRDEDDNGSIQMILLEDIEQTNGKEGSICLGIEDIMRPSGDKDFNDLIVNITYDPVYSYDTSGMLVLLGTEKINMDCYIADTTGLYLNLTDTTLDKMIKNINAFKYKFVHKIKTQNNESTTYLKSVFDHIIFENPTVVEYLEENESNNGELMSLLLTFNIIKDNINSYIYIFKSSKNNDQINEDLDPFHKNIVLFQCNYIYGKVEDFLEIYSVDLNGVETKELDIVNRPDTSRMGNPISMGDPHITTIKGDRYDILDDITEFNLFDDGELCIDAFLDVYPDNESIPEYSKLKFVKYFDVKIHNKYMYYRFIIDMFNVDKYYNSEMCELENLPLFIKEVDYSRVINLIKHPLNLPCTHYETRILEFNTINMGNLYFMMIFAPCHKDYINNFTILSNGLTFTQATGAIIDKRFYNPKL
jgi:hypothetical protein